MERTLAKAAEYLGTTRPKLIKLMREKGLLNERNLPAFPVRDREYLRVKDSNWFHAELGMQYSQSTRVRQPGMAWLHLYKRAGKDGQAIAGHASETMTKNYQKDHADVIWSDAIPDLDISEISGT